MSRRPITGEDLYTLYRTTAHVNGLHPPLSPRNSDQAKRLPEWHELDERKKQIWDLMSKDSMFKWLSFPVRTAEYGTPTYGVKQDEPNANGRIYAVTTFVDAQGKESPVLTDKTTHMVLSDAHRVPGGIRQTVVFERNSEKGEPS